MEDIERDNPIVREEADGSPHDVGVETNRSSVDLVKHCDCCEHLSMPDAHQCYHCYASLEDVPCVPASLYPENYYDQLDGHGIDHEQGAQDLFAPSESSKRLVAAPTRMPPRLRLRQRWQTLRRLPRTSTRRRWSSRILTAGLLPALRQVAVAVITTHSRNTTHPWTKTPSTSTVTLTGHHHPLSRAQLRPQHPRQPHVGLGLSPLLTWAPTTTPLSPM